MASPAPVEIDAGSDGVMTCSVQAPAAYPLSSSGWYNSVGTQISTVVKTTANDVTTLVMTITAATVSDNGQYYCQVTYTDSAIGIVTSEKANLYVNGKSSVQYYRHIVCCSGLSMG